MSPDDLNRVFAALADPTRRAIVARLAAGEATVNELAEPFDLAQPSVSKHLKVLEAAGLISRGREGQTRPCRLEITTLKAMTGWVEHYVDVWEASFDRFDALLQSTGPTSAKGKRHDRKR